MEPGCIGKSNTNNLLARTDLTKNPYEKKNHFFKDATRKSASMVVSGIEIELQPWRPIFEKCSHLREKGGVQIFSPGLYSSMVGCMGRISHTNLKIRMVVSRIATSKNHYCTYDRQKITDVGTFSFR